MAQEGERLNPAEEIFVAVHLEPCTALFEDHLCSTSAQDAPPLHCWHHGLALPLPTKVVPSTSTSSTCRSTSAQRYSEAQTHQTQAQTQAHRGILKHKHNPLSYPQAQLISSHQCQALCLHSESLSGFPDVRGASQRARVSSLLDLKLHMCKLWHLTGQHFSMT